VSDVFILSRDEWLKIERVWDNLFSGIGLQEKRRRKVIIVRSSEAKGYLTPPPHRRELKVLISPDMQKEVEGLAVGMTILPPGESSSFHSHDAECETWIIISGVGEVRVGDEREPVSPETVVFLKPRIKHQITNTGKEPLRMFWVYTPPGGERSILEEKMN
jgi:mannose-6-phosphate isomerase-like protein (cupin superfamily)